MLKAYDYVEIPASRAAIQTSEQYNEEQKLAKAAVDRVLQLNNGNFTACPGCGGTHLTHFFSKWEVSYLRCMECGTIFCAVDDNTLAAYQSDTELCKFRLDEAYQQEATQKREQSWKELIDWIQFRSFRYLHKKEALRVLSGGSRYTGFTKLLLNSGACASYAELGQPFEEGKPTRAEIALSFNLIQQSNKPVKQLAALNRRMEKGALLFVSARLGTGFDILVLREHAQVYPYEFVTLLSRQGLMNALHKAGFALLDYSTPGVMDVGYVHSNRAFIAEGDLFTRSLIFDSDQTILGEFQRFLQKSGMSSYAHIVARKEEER